MVHRGTHDRGNDQASLVPCPPSGSLPRRYVQQVPSAAAFHSAGLTVYIQEAICYLFQRRPSYAQTNGFPCRTTYGASASCLFATRRTT
jgi:hypothetical protein